VSAGTYVFQTIFDLTGFNLAATSITVACGTDNALNAVRLNGTVVAGDCDHFNPFPTGTFVIASGFAAGNNTLQFDVFDAGSPMAFRAQFTSETRPGDGGGPVIPEPTTLLLVGSGIAGIAARAKKRKTQV
jgi:hypothetical protein